MELLLWLSQVNIKLIECLELQIDITRAFIMRNTQTEGRCYTMTCNTDG